MRLRIIEIPSIIAIFFRNGIQRLDAHLNNGYSSEIFWGSSSSRISAAKDAPKWQLDNLNN